MEEFEHPSVCSTARGLSGGEDGHPCGCWWLPLWSAERPGQRLHVGGKHCRTVWADRAGNSNKHHWLALIPLYNCTVFFFSFASLIVIQLVTVTFSFRALCGQCRGQ